MQIFEGTNQIQRLVISRDLARGLCKAADLRILMQPFFAIDVGTRHVHILA